MFASKFSKLIACVFFVTSIATSAHAVPVTGQPAPEFTGTDSHGKTHKLSDYKGKVVVLEWTNHECPFVKKFYSVGKMQELQKAYTDKGVVWLSIVSSAEGKQGNLKPEQANAIMLEKKFASTAMILDPTGEIGKLYNAKTTPHMFVVSKDGTLAYMGAIDDKKSTDSEDIAGARNYVASAVDQVLAGQQVAIASTTSYGCSVKY
jgi:peroxiredoxin